MSFLDVNFSEASGGKEFGVVPSGEYEVYAEKFDTTPAGTGTKRTNFRFKIREDVQQDHKNRILFHDFYHTPNTKNIIIGFLKELDEDADGVSFSSQEEFAQFVLMKPVRAKVVVDEYMKKDGTKGERNRISFFKKTDHPVLSATVSEDIVSVGSSTPEPALTISEDDLPF